MDASQRCLKLSRHRFIHARLMPCEAYAYHITVNYRESYGLFACNGILFNHESERRGETFVSPAIFLARPLVSSWGSRKSCIWGTLRRARDWGFAGDYVEAMWLMLQADEADDFVIATGEHHSVREFLDDAFGRLDLDWNEFVRFAERYFRPAEVDLLLGDSSKARRVLWEPKASVQELVRMMVASDLELARQERTLVDNGHRPIQLRAGRIAA